MVYLDYSATTPVNEEVIETYAKVCREFIGNPNSLHKLGVNAKRLIDASSKQIADILGVKSSEIIYTSGASEANNMAIKGIVSRYSNRGKVIITTHLEHSSISSVLKYLEEKGFIIKYVKLDDNGLVDLNDLEELMTDEVLLVTIASINSEVGIRQDLEAISKVVRKNPRTIFHSDVTQSIGKEIIDFSLFDLASFSGQKFYGMKGIGCLYKRDNLVIDSLIHGGKSTTAYRSGTPATPLIASLAKALRLVYLDFENKCLKVKELNEYLMDKLRELDIYINSNSYSIPNIINVSLKNIKSEVMLHGLENKDIYISTTTACSSGSYSEAVYALTNDMDRASRSLRISLSFLTTKEEVDIFIAEFKKQIDSLNFK